MKYNQVYIFDFCETLVNRQTADDFIEFVLKYPETPQALLRRFYFLGINILSRLNFFIIINKIFGENSLEKGLRLFSLINLNEAFLNQLGIQYSNNLKDKININIWRVFEKIEINRRIICSGGYNIYLEHFFSDDKVEGLLCTEFNFKNQKFTGFWKGKDCMREEKVKKLKDFGVKPSEYEVMVYTDSPSDLPLLNFANRGVVVGRNQQPDWAKKFEFLTWN